jgi:hypothetical protein
VIEKARSSVQSTIDGIIQDLKAKAAANPTAVLAIGAGIAWRLVQRPPIATALVGAGLYSLLRTTPVHSGPGWQDADYLAHAKARMRAQAGEAVEIVKEQAMEMAGSFREQAADVAEAATEKVRQWGTEAKKAVEQGASDVQDHAAAAVQRSSEALGDARQIAEDAFAKASASARQTASALAGNAQANAREAGAMATMAAGQASSSVQAALSDQETRDKLLLGAAGLAVAAALGIAAQRRLSEAP